MQQPFIDINKLENNTATPNEDQKVIFLETLPFTSPSLILIRQQAKLAQTQNKFEFV
jgi:hypothetical protein